METTPGNPKYLTNIILKESGREEMEKLGNFWIGPDVALDRKIIVPPGLAKEVRLAVSKKDLPPVKIHRGILSVMQWSVRSCLAQSGIDVIFHHGDLPDEAIVNLDAGRDIVLPVSVINHSGRPVELEGGLMRFFWVNNRNRLTGESLRNIIGKELIIEGEEGRDWQLGDASQVKGVCVVLPVEGKFYIPPSDEVLRVKSKKDLPNILKDLPEKGKQAYFTVGETAKVKLGNDIVAVLWAGGYDQQGRHIYSPLIDPGFEGPIRTEAVYGLSSVDLYVYKKDKAK